MKTLSTYSRLAFHLLSPLSRGCPAPSRGVCPSSSPACRADARTYNTRGLPSSSSPPLRTDAQHLLEACLPPPSHPAVQMSSTYSRLAFLLLFTTAVCFLLKGKFDAKILRLSSCQRLLQNSVRCLLCREFLHNATILLTIECDHRDDGNDKENSLFFSRGFKGLCP